MIKKTDIPNDTVSFAKMQNAEADNVVVGNVAGAGEPLKELTAAQVAGIVDGELLIDEDDMVSDLDTKAPTQQSTKAYVDASVSDPDVVLVSTQTASSSATISFTDLSSTYFKYVVEFVGITPQTEGDEFGMRVSSDNGSSYDSGAGNYGYLNWQAHWTGTNRDSGTTTYGPVVYNPTNTTEDVGNGTGEFLHGRLEVFTPTTSAYTYAKSDFAYLDETGSLCHGQNSIVRLTASAVDAIQFFFTTGNIATGTLKLYGYK
jgi:hypothetical protein